MKAKSMLTYRKSFLRANYFPKSLAKWKAAVKTDTGLWLCIKHTRDTLLVLLILNLRPTHFNLSPKYLKDSTGWHQQSIYFEKWKNFKSEIYLVLAPSGSCSLMQVAAIVKQIKAWTSTDTWQTVSPGFSHKANCKSRDGDFQEVKQRTRFF